MKEKQKSLYCFILERLWAREKFVTILFVIACFVIIEVDSPMMIRYILELLGVDTSSLFQKDSFLCVLSISYISGVLVYFLTILLPEAQRSKPILIEVENSLRYLKDELYSIIEFINSENSVDIAMHYIEQQKKFDSEFFDMYGGNQILDKIHQALETLTLHVLSHSSVLYQSELETLVDIRHRSISRRIRFKYEENEILCKKQVKDEFDKLVQLNKDIINLHDNIKKRIEN